MSDPTQQVDAALNRFRQLGDQAPLQQEATNVAELAVAPANSHVHLPPNFSAFSSVDQAVTLASEQGLAVLGVSNYYDYTVYGPFSEMAVKQGIFPLYGTELIGMMPELRDKGERLNDPGNPGKIYICGKGITGLQKPSEKAEHWLDTIRSNDKQRMAKMIELVSGVFQSHGLDVTLTFDQIVSDIATRYGCPAATVWLQERHIAEAFEKALNANISEAELPAVLEKLLGKPSKAASANDAATIQGELRSALMKAGKPAFVEEQFIELEGAMELIYGLQGIPCYPVLADGADPMCEFEQDPVQLAERIKALGFLAAELIPIRNSPQVLREFTQAFHDAGLIVTAGTEHNTPDLIPMMPTCKDGSEIAPDLQAIYWQGACCIAAHQYLKLNGEPGCTGVELSTTTIADLAKLGQVVMQRYVNA